MGARWPRGGACSAAPVTIVITRSLNAARTTTSRIGRSQCRNFYDAFIGMATSCAELWAGWGKRFCVPDVVGWSLYLEFEVGRNLSQSGLCCDPALWGDERTGDRGLLQILGSKCQFWVINGRGDRSHMPIHVRFAPKATVGS